MELNTISKRLFRLMIYVHSIVQRVYGTAVVGFRVDFWNLLQKTKRRFLRTLKRIQTRHSHVPFSRTPRDTASRYG